MPLFAAVLRYTDDKDRIQEVRPTHREYLRGLLDQGKLLQSGPFADDVGALMIYETADIAEAQAILTNDPFAQHGVIVAAELNEWNPIFQRDS